MSDPKLGPRSINLIGRTFTRLTVTGYAGKSKYGYNLWSCICFCGTEKTFPSSSLLSKLSQSCGCLRVENTRRMRLTHGKSKTREHSIWVGIHKRCKNKNIKHWNEYGGRGIQVCERWNSFENFLSDMGPCPPGHTIERKDNDGHYEPDNCVWATRKVQSRNQRDNHRITYQGRTRCLHEWAELLGANPASLRYRLKHGWSVERALTEPFKKRNQES